MTRILLKLTEEYQTIIKILEEKLYDKYDLLTIESIIHKILVKFDKMNK